MRSLISCLLLFLTAIGFSQETDWQQFMQNTSAPLLAVEDYPQPERTTTPTKTEMSNVRSVKKSLFYSLLLPGAGQAYNKSWYKAAGFFALEVVGWTAFAVYNAEGNDIEDEFEQFADDHWDENYYWKWVFAQSDLTDPYDKDALREWEHENFSHGLHVDKDQQYYEMIGKYYQFNYGWDDFRQNYDISINHATMTNDKMISPNRQHYEDRRHASNTAFKAATTGATVVLFNHILSAFESAVSAKLHNDKVQTALRFEPILINSEPQTVLTLHLNW